jgi:hypothetical protein
MEVTMNFQPAYYLSNARPLPHWGARFRRLPEHAQICASEERPKEVGAQNYFMRPSRPSSSSLAVANRRGSAPSRLDDRIDG